MKTLQSLIVALGLVASGSACQGAAIWDWTWTSTTITGSGTLTTAEYDVAQSGWHITAITGSMAGTIQGQDFSGPVSLDNAFLASWQYGSSDAVNIGAATLYVFLNATPSTMVGNPDGGFISAPSHFVDGTFTATDLSPVPEPSEWAAISFALLGVVWMAKRRFAPARA